MNAEHLVAILMVSIDVAQNTEKSSSVREAGVEGCERHD